MLNSALQSGAIVSVVSPSSANANADATSSSSSSSLVQHAEGFPFSVAVATTTLFAALQTAQADIEQTGAPADAALTDAHARLALSLAQVTTHTPSLSL